MDVSLHPYGHTRIKGKSMQRIAKFEKVSYAEFSKVKLFDESTLRDIYDNIKLPTRATAHSAGYDFFAPFDITLKVGEELAVPTGIRVKMEDGWVLKIYPRSGLGFKYRLQLNNTTGIIDGDYYYSDNEGHIFCKIFNDGRTNKTVEIKQGDGFCQGIFCEYGITYDDDATAIRNGGFGSTDGGRSATN